MADSSTYLVVGGVLLVIIGIMMYNNKMAKRPPRLPGGDDSDSSVDPWLCRFVRQGDMVVGEVVAMEGEALILKQSGVFKAVPRSQVKDVGDELVLQGDVEWEDAQVAGAAWLATHRRGADPEVTSDLTRSEDVKAPALQAFQDREEE